MLHPPYMAVLLYHPVLLLHVFHHSAAHTATLRLLVYLHSWGDRILLITWNMNRDFNKMTGVFSTLL